MRVESVDVEGWAQFHLLDDGGRTVGAVYEDRQWANDDNYGAVRYLVVHNPRLTVGDTCWRSEGHATVPEAVHALEKHLRDAHDA